MFVLVEFADHVGTITLNQPAKRNALSRGLVEELLAALTELQRHNARVVILRAAADAAVWSAGHDISELSPGADPLLYSDALERLIRAVRSYPAPVIAMVHGTVWGGATDLALSCDMIVGDETCSFAITPVNLGLAYNTAGLLHFMRRLPLNLVKEMFFTATPIQAEAAAAWGILNHLVPADDLESFTLEQARLISAKAPLAVASIKEQLRILVDADPLSAQDFEYIQALRQRVYQSADYQEGLRAFREKRRPKFNGE